MKNVNILLVMPLIFAFAVILSGCVNSSLDETNLTPEGEKIAPEPTATEEDPAQPEPEPSETPFLEPAKDDLEAEEVPVKILEEITADLKELSGTEVGDIKVIRAEAVVWNDGSLGCPKPGEFYIQMLINGYWVVLEVEGVEYDYRVSGTGHFILCEGEGLPPITSLDTNGQTQNPLVNQAEKDLAERLDIQITDIELLKIEEVTWPNTSLSCPQPGLVYAAVITPGYLILLEASEQVYVFHTDMDNTVILCDPSSGESSSKKSIDKNVDDGWPNQPKDDVIIKLTPTKRP